MGFSEDPVVELSTGRIRGRREGQVDYFLGIPYAGETGGSQRFRPPTSVRSWSGVREMTVPGPRAPQPPNAFNAPADLQVIYPESDQPQSENCLCLNVWTPRAEGGGNRPVMVWLHGGGFISGVGLRPWTSGERLASAQDVVVVSLNHRLGALGFLYLGDLCVEDKCPTGLLGMLDIVAALRWIQQNIAAFGGDPSCVTLFGQSGGGAKICALMAMPEAQGLFHRVIVQSGPALRFMKPPDAAATTRSLLDLLGIPPRDFRKLWALPAHVLVDAQHRLAAQQAAVPFALRRRVGFNPVVDGRWLPRDPFDPDAPPLSTRTPMLIGTNADEMALFLSHAPWAAANTEESAAFAAAPRVLGIDEKHAKRILQIYRTQQPDWHTGRLLIAAATDLCVRLDSLHMAELQRASGAPVYVYLFNWGTRVLAGRLGAAHSVDVPFVFDQLSASPLVGDPDSQPLANAMSMSWAAFARTGSPQCPALPDWPCYDLPNRPTMCFDIPSTLESDPLREQRLAWMKDISVQCQTEARNPISHPHQTS